jgi:crossover junction endodeoxyribonuclease RuvC
VRIFGIDPGSIRTGYGCVETDGTRHRLVLCGAIRTPARQALPPRLQVIHRELRRLIDEAAPIASLSKTCSTPNTRAAL